ncbi:nuclease [Clostridium sporogenes]|uniref:Nuclease n=1 Tax=Clostridium botulinum TaxID=1491 RepID=A0A6B3YLY3_CLOBO|nr:nuclease [Clostridium sporogenes]NFA60843.1 nuclease [Clostridium botulinum]NFB57090.1 nuclease [Clostridium botulinum]NFB60723.1 nuclease [Clostridium botulinum]NFI72484.1 nuclease [Clostridium sporogenes]NFL73337.1 nuclease [Clostridium sporogenes]
MLIKQGNINKCGIYGIKTSKAVVKYVGGAKECNDAYSRHKSNLINGEYAETNKNELQVLFNTEQEDLIFYLIKECNEDELDFMETKYINLYKNTIVNSEENGKRRKSKPTKEETERRRRANTGEKNPHNTKLTKQDVKEIKLKLKKGARQIDLAEQYNVSPTHLWNIANGKRWNSVQV